MASTLQSEFSKMSLDLQVKQIMSWTEELRGGNSTFIPDIEAVLLRGEEISRMVAVQMVLPELIRANVDRGVAIIQSLIQEKNPTLDELLSRTIYPVLAEPKVAQKMIESYHSKTQTPALRHGVLVHTL